MGRTIWDSKKGERTFTAKFFHELSGGEVYEILKARAAVFVVEQKLNYVDMDDVDYDSLHCFIAENGRVTAYLRAFYEKQEAGSKAAGCSPDDHAPDDHAPDDQAPAGRTVKIGRVLTIAHGRGEGRALMELGLRAISERMGSDHFCLDAQKYAAGFYEKFDFRTISPDFLEEGIVHVKMEYLPSDNFRRAAQNTDRGGKKNERNQQEQ